MSRQQIYNARASRSLRIMRQIAKDFGYSVGGHGGSEIDRFMDDIESGKIIVTQAHKVNLQPNKKYFETGDAAELQINQQPGQPLQPVEGGKGNKMTIKVFQQHIDLLNEYQKEINEQHEKDKQDGCTCGHPQATATNAGQPGKVSFGVDKDTDPYCPIHGWEE